MTHAIRELKHQAMSAQVATDGERSLRDLLLDAIEIIDSIDTKIADLQRELTALESEVSRG